MFVYFPIGQWTGVELKAVGAVPVPVDPNGGHWRLMSRFTIPDNWLELAVENKADPHTVAHIARAEISARQTGAVRGLSPCNVDGSSLPVVESDARKGSAAGVEADIAAVLSYHTCHKCGAFPQLDVVQDMTGDFREHIAVVWPCSCWSGFVSVQAIAGASH